VSRSLLVVALVFAPFAAAQDRAKSGRPTIEQLMDQTPTNPAWCAGCRHVVFTWDRAGVANLMSANGRRSRPPVAVTSFPKGNRASVMGRDSQTVYFPHDGHLWQASLAQRGGSAKPAVE